MERWAQRNWSRGGIANTDLSKILYGIDINLGDIAMIGIDAAAPTNHDYSLKSFVLSVVVS